MDISDDLRQRVAIGTLFLDQTIPDWRDKINVLDLDLSDPAACVLGQLFELDAEYADAPFGPFTMGSFKFHDWAEFNDVELDDLGTVAGGFEREDSWEEYETMTVAWLEVIADKVPASV